MALFKRTSRTDFTGLEEALGRPAEVLAHGTGDGVVVVGTREVLAVRRDGAWAVWPWERVSGGGWRAETGSFRWKTVDGETHEATLKEANLLPQLFRERIEASTVVQSLIDAPRQGQVQIIGRRSLGKNPSVDWYAVPSGGADLSDPATSAAVIEETDRLSAEYFGDGMTPDWRSRGEV